MPRRIFLGLVVAAAIGFAIYLVADDPVRDFGQRAARLHAGHGQRAHDIQRRRMFLLPCRARPTRSPETRRRTCHHVAIRDLLCAQHLARSRRWHRAMDRSAIRQRGDKGHRAVGRAFFPRLSLYVLSARQDRRHPRSLRLPEDAGAGAGRVRDHDVPFPFNIRRNIGIWKLLFMDGKPFTPDAARSAQWNRGAYLVNSSRALRRVPQSAQFSRRHHRRASASPADPIRKARAGCRTSRKRDLANGAPRTSPTSSKPGRRPTATPPADRWRA